MGVASVAIVELSVADLARRRDELASLLADAIEDNASVGFVLPVDEALLDAFWARLERELRDGSRVLFAALDGERIIGSVQLALCTKPNQPHRADVQKLLVLRSTRGRGVGEALMRALERRATDAGRWLLVLDTRTGSAADGLYRKWGWQTVGEIPDFALDPDGTLAACTFYWKRLA